MKCIARAINLNRCGREATSGPWRLFCKEHRWQPIRWLFVFFFVVVPAIVAFWAILRPERRPEKARVNTFWPSEKKDANAGKAVLTSVREFPVEGNYVPSGKMGDTADVTINEMKDGARRFTYETLGRGPHHWEYRYSNDEPAQCAGVMYLSPPNVWGTLPDCGYDLRGFHRITGEARSRGGSVNVNLVVGGIDWFWDEQTKEKVTPPFGDLMRKSVSQNLNEEWTRFSILLNEPEDHLKRVVGGFGWSICWGENQITINSKKTAENPKTFIIEIRDVKYLKGPLAGSE